MYVAINHIPADPEMAQVLAARLASRARLVDGRQGFRSFELLKPLPGFGHGWSRGTEYLVVTRWDGAACFEAWLHGPERQHAHATPAAHADAAESRAWLTTHAAFEVAYGGRWHAAAWEAWLPVAFLNVVDVARSHETAFEEAFHTRERGVETQPGFLALEVLRPIRGSWDGPEHVPTEPCSTYVVFSRWESADTHTAWTKSEAFRRAHGRGRLPEGAVLRAGVRSFSILHPAYKPEPVEAAR
jgi:heme-degrading monooxygenase HmoA